MSSAQDDRILLRLSDIRRLEEQLVDAERAVSEAVKKRDALLETVTAGRRFLDLVSEPLGERDSPEFPEDIDFTQETLRIIRTAVRPLLHEEIRAELAKFTSLAQRLRTTPNYYYTVIDRLLKRGHIVRDGKRYSAASEKNSPPLAGASGGVNGSGVSSVG